MSRIGFIAVFVSLALPGLAFAQAEPPAMAPGASPPGAMAESGHGPDIRMQKLQARFNAANTTHDGHLTFQQAQAADMKMVVRHFSEIDTRNRGFITFNDIEAWRLDRVSQKLEQRAAQLRAEN